MICALLVLNSSLNLPMPGSMFSASPPATMLIAWNTSSPTQTQSGKATLPLNSGSHRSIQEVIGFLIRLVLTARP